MAVSERLRVILEMVTGQYKREAREAASATDKIGGSAAEAGSKTGQLRQKMSGLSTTAKVAIAGAATAAFTHFTRTSIRAARDLGESVNAVNQVFGAAADKIHQFGDISAQVAGLSKREFNELATNTGALLTNMGLSLDEAATQAIRLTTRAADMASVFNTDVSEALEAINAGLRGETEPLRRFGVQLSDAEVRAKAVEMGLADTTAEVDKHGKAVAALELIYEQTAKVQGDFIDTSDELANSQRKAAAEWENAQARFGQAAIPVLTDITSFASDALLSLQALGDNRNTLEAILGKVGFNVDLGGQPNEVAAAALRMQEAIRNIQAAGATGGDPFTALADSLLHLARSGDLTAAQFEALAVAAGLPADEIEDFRRSVLDQAEAMGLSEELTRELAIAMGLIEGSGSSAGEVVVDLGDAAETAGEQVAESGEQAQTAANRYRDLLSAWMEATDPIFNAVRQLQALEEAQGKVNELAAEGKGDTDEFRQAQLDLAEQMLETQAALDQVDPSDLERGIEGIAEALDISTGEVEDLLRQLDLLDGKTVRAVIETRRQVFDLDPTTGISSGGGVIVGQATGGFIPANRPTLVGEGGRAEVVTPVRDSLTFPSIRHFEQAMRMGRGDVTINVPIEGTGDMLVDAQRAGAIAEVLRRMETL